MPRRLTQLTLIGFLLLLLSACTLYVTPGETTIRGSLRFGIELSDVITQFEPTRGTGAIYQVGDQIEFRVRTTTDGYLTFTAIDPDGDVYVFARNIFIYGGQSTIISGPSARQAFVLTPPRGMHRVRVSFTPSRTSGSVRYSGNKGDELWTQSIVTEIDPYDVRDIAETRFYLQ